jgi:hypothetical protein
MSTMHLSFPAGASMEEIEAIVERGGFDAMYDADYDAGEQAHVDFYPAEKKEKRRRGAGE